MKTKLVAAALAATMASPAFAFNPIDWFMGKAVEKVAEDAVEDAVKKALFGEPAATTAKKGKADKAKPAPTPEATKVGERDYGLLPLTGTYRFPVPKDTALKDLAVGDNGGYIDRFGSEWIPYRANGRLVAWRSNLSERGRLRMAKFADGNGFLLVGRDGKKISTSE